MVFYDSCIFAINPCFSLLNPRFSWVMASYEIRLKSSLLLNLCGNLSSEVLVLLLHALAYLEANELGDDDIL